MEGWGKSKSTRTTGDSTGAMLGVLFLFIFPKNLSFLFGSKNLIAFLFG
jgi:hypothetical protein